MHAKVEHTAAAGLGVVQLGCDAAANAAAGPTVPTLESRSSVSPSVSLRPAAPKFGSPGSARTDQREQSRHSYDEDYRLGTRWAL